MIGFVGGTGLEGRGLAFRMALLGEKCLLGSRNPDRATSYKDELVEMDENINGLVEIGSNRDVAELCDLIFITIPYNAVRSVLFEIKDQLSGKIVISTVVPLGFSNNGVELVSIVEGSAAQEIEKILPDSYVLSAFQNLSAQKLLSKTAVLDSDVIVCGDDQNSKNKLIDLINLVDGLRGLDGGDLSNSGMVENITALLITLNKIHHTNSSIRISGI